MSKFNLDTAVRKVPDFPKEGILFYDITGILQNPEALDFCIDEMADYCKEHQFDAIAAVEARGFIFGAPLAARLGLPLILVRKKGKLPGKTITRSFALEYGEDVVEIQECDVDHGNRILLLDDLIATGGTLKAAAELMQEAGGIVEHIMAVIGLPFLKYGEVLKEFKIKTLLNYHSE